MGIEPVPVIGFSYLIPGPVRRLKVLKDNTYPFIFIGVIAPDVEIPRLASGSGTARLLEPGVLVGGMVDYQLGDDAQATAMGFIEKALKSVICP